MISFSFLGGGLWRLSAVHSFSSGTQCFLFAGRGGRAAFCGAPSPSDFRGDGPPKFRSAQKEGDGLSAQPGIDIPSVSHVVVFDMGRLPKGRVLGQT